MWGSYIAPIAALAVLPCANAITLHKRSDPAVVGLPITRSEHSPALRKRDDTVNATLYNSQNSQYFINITVGTPPQELSLTLDTGSSDIWVNVPNSTYCSADDDVCSSDGVFTQKDSKTFELLDYELNATYASGFLAEGPYATDTISVGGVDVEDQQFAVAYKSKNPSGIFGIGYSKSTYAASKYDKQYKTFPESLVESGAIKSNAYSLWLNEFDGNGNILFGGVNKAKYSGELESVPVLKLYGDYYSLAIALTDISVKDKSYGTGLPLAVSLDNGSPFIALPKEIVDPIYKEVNGGHSSTAQVGYVSCDMADSDYNVTFSFSGAKVSIPMSQLVYTGYTAEGLDDDDCIFGITQSQPGVNLMGDPFLRGAYVVYDLDNNEISLANANYDGGDDDIHEIGTGSDAVPDATNVKSPVTSATGNGVEKTPTAGSEPAGTTSFVVASTTASDSTATETADSGSATSTSSTGAAALPTSNGNHLIPGILGAGLLLAL